MSTLSELEQKVLSLPAQDRERLALTMWNSLESDGAFDPEGARIALARDNAIETGATQAISHAEFQRLTRSQE